MASGGTRGRRSKPASRTRRAHRAGRSDAKRRAGASSPEPEPRPLEEAADGSRPLPAFLVAAIGASAGGLEAFSRLVSSMPGDAPLALILVQHLAPDQPSLLREILASRTALTVVEARDAMLLHPGNVYVLPPGTDVTVYDGRLAISPRVMEHGRPNTQIDRLFRSTAEHFGERAVGVVLSGGAQDGAAGLRIIKDAGGTTIVERPEDAKIDSMPRAAIATGAVDKILPIAEIGPELVRLASLPPFNCDHASVAAPSAEAPPMPETDPGTLQTIFRLMRRTAGIDLTAYKRPTISRRIERRIALHRLSGIDEYRGLLENDPEEIERLQEDLFIHVTSFFREPESFAALQEKVFPKLHAQSADGPVRIWIPGCASGEEAYSTAIAFIETLGGAIGGEPFQIFGTDISNLSIDRARSGIYPESITADVSPERLRRFFSRVEGGYRIAKSIRDGCVFARQDITRDPPFSKLDLVVCRNMLIYLVQAVQRKVMALFHYALKPNGFLLLGRAETVGQHTELFDAVDKKLRIYTKRSVVVPPDVEFPKVPIEVRTPARATARMSSSTGARAAVYDEADRLLLDRYAPPGIVVDSDLRILRARGRTAPFLELPNGDVSLNLMKMAREGLLPDLRAAIETARRSGGRVRKEAIPIRSGATEERVSLDVTPFGAADSRCFLVSFEVKELAEARAPASRKSEAQAPTRRWQHTVDQLKHELAANRQELQANIYDLAAANEELQSANEEILSSNEELQSTNEELDTAKEELQSTNEELSTLNDELHHRNDELSRANSDLGNLLVNVQIPIIMVGRDLRITRFTPAAEKMFNLIASDAGRPISHLKPNLRCPELGPIISEVIDTITPHECDVRDVDDEGHTFSLRIRPYKSVDNRIDGAVITLVDVSLARDALKVAAETSETLMAAVREPLLLLRPDLRVQRANQAFADSFLTSRAETENQLVYELRGGQWNVAGLRSLLESVLPERHNFHGFALDLDFAGGGRRRFLLDGHGIHSGRSGGIILLVIREEPGHA